MGSWALALTSPPAGQTCQVRLVRGDITKLQRCRWVGGSTLSLDRAVTQMVLNVLVCVFLLLFLGPSVLDHCKERLKTLFGIFFGRDLFL